MRNGPNPRNKNRGRNNNNMNNGMRRTGNGGNPGSNNNNNNYPRPQTVFESNGPEGKIRGNAQQIFEKYIALASDASVSDDKVLSESFFQHAEHYLRLMLRDTDIDYDTYRREQQMRRDGLLNAPMDDDNDFDDECDMTAISDDMSETDNVGNTVAENFSEQATAPVMPRNEQPREDRRRFTERRPPAIKAAENVNRMIDPPGFLSPIAPIQKKEIKIESAAKSEQKSLELNVEPA